jgi:hypothetical protein
MIKKILILIAFFLPQLAGATIYYADFTNGSDTNDGLSTTTPFQSLNKFANNARSAGDTLYVRRNQASTTNVTSVTFTSDGTLNNPISISADYDNLWNDFSTLSETATPVFGSKEITVSASSTAIHNSWIYFGDDCSENATTSTAFKSQNFNSCEYAYEVASSSAGKANTILTLYLPYKGRQSGSGVSIRQMGKAPQVGTVTEANIILNITQDFYWVLKGLDIRSTSGSCPGRITQSGDILYDLIIQGNGSGDCGFGSDMNNVHFNKTRVFNVANFSDQQNGNVTMINSLVDCNNVANSVVINGSGFTGLWRIKSTEIKNCGTLLVSSASGNQSGGSLYLTNVVNNNIFANLSAGQSFVSGYFEDNFNVVGLNSQISNLVSSNTLSTTTISTTTSLRSGGGLKNLFTMPPTGTGNSGISTKNFPYSYIKLFEYPIYADTSSKTYSMYFMATSSTAFNINPLTSTQTGSTTPELYIECEYYNASSGADRFLKRSNTAGAFTADGTWYPISVTCQPTQSGILYLRGWYAKPNDGRSNFFYMDTTPVIQ